VTATRSDATAALERLLRRRPLSEGEARARLERLAFSAAEVAEALSTARDERWVDDALLARLWIEDRLLHHPLSRRAIEVDLRARGIAPATVSQALADLYPSEKERDVAMALAEERLARSPCDDPRKRDERVIGFLVRRGFSTSMAVDAVRKAVTARDG
jgi:regulatory protein